MQTHSILSPGISGPLRTKTVSIWFAILLGVSHADSPLLPGWLEERRELLPPVSSEAIDTMREAWPNSSMEDTIDGESGEIPLKNARACKAIADLGGDAANALIWLYAEEPPPGKVLLPETQMAKARMLGALYYDQKAGMRLVPLLRARLDWARKEFMAGTIGKTCFSAVELKSLAMTLNLYGTEADFKNAISFEEELKTVPGTVGEEARAVFQLPVEERMHRAALSKSVDRQVSHPYGNPFRVLVESRPDIFGKAASRMAPADSSVQPASSSLPGAGPRSERGHPDARSGTSKSVLAWWIVVPISACVCLLLMLRRMKA
ncbi:MAG: hypothetical protein K1X78_28265 [Verrucomicrobiaceae bacterium]|nr:hypothetical protein [Verrucomicrobiaceae bacterium]